MARRGRRYETEGKLNIKKVIAVIVFILVVIMFVIGIKYLLGSHTKSTSGKIETLTYYTAYDNGKWGVINSYGEVVINATYDEMIVIPDHTRDVFICTYDTNYGKGTYKTKVINSKDKEIIKGYETVEPIINYDKNQNMWYEENVIKVKRDLKFGLCDLTGKRLLACDYESIEPIKGIKNSFVIRKGGKARTM